MKASRSPLIGRVIRSDAHCASFGFASEYIKGARLDGFEFRQGVDSNREKRQVSEVDRSTNGRAYFRPNSAITTTVRNGSVAVIQTNSSRMAALEWKADTRPGRMSALTDTGRSAALKRADLNVSMRQFVITDRVCLIDVVRP
jgi:hypothetical protein